MSEDKVGKLEEEALKRKERLKNLKRRRDGESVEEKQESGTPAPLPA